MWVTGWSPPFQGGPLRVPAWGQRDGRKPRASGIVPARTPRAQTPGDPPTCRLTNTGHRRCPLLSQVFQRGQDPNVYVMPRSAVRPDTTIRVRVRHLYNELWSEWSPTLRIGEGPTLVRRGGIFVGVPVRGSFSGSYEDTCHWIQGQLISDPSLHRPCDGPVPIKSCSYVFGHSLSSLQPLSVEGLGAVPAQTPSAACPAALHPLLCSWGHPRRTHPQTEPQDTSPLGYSSLSPAQVSGRPWLLATLQPRGVLLPPGSQPGLRGAPPIPLGALSPPLLYGVTEGYPKPRGLQQDSSHHAAALAARNREAGFYGSPGLPGTPHEASQRTCLQGHRKPHKAGIRRCTPQGSHTSALGSNRA